MLLIVIDVSKTSAVVIFRVKVISQLMVFSNY